MTLCSGVCSGLEGIGERLERALRSPSAGRELCRNTQTRPQFSTLQSLKAKSLDSNSLRSTIQNSSTAVFTTYHSIKHPGLCLPCSRRLTEIGQIREVFALTRCVTLREFQLSRITKRKNKAFYDSPAPDPSPLPNPQPYPFVLSVGLL